LSPAIVDLITKLKARLHRLERSKLHQVAVGTLHKALLL